jgi:hypothetical protein
MSVASGPNISTNGLVLCYDMGNPQTSWEGAPTTNLVDPNWSSWSIDGSGQGSIGTRTITGSFACTITDVSANTRQNIYISTGISASTTYTFSVQYQKLSGTPTLRFQIQAYNGATYLSTISFPTTAQLGITDIDGWQTAKITITTPASTNRILWFMQDGDDYTAYTHSFMLANVQCEQQSFATPFVWGTRSNTQAILDLTGLDIITATSLTYLSDGSFTFNGSNNYLTISTFASKPTTAITCESWIKPTKPTVTGTIRGGSISSTNSMYLGIIDSTDGGVTFSLHWANQTSVSRIQSWNGNVPNNAWSHIVGTYDGTIMRAYLNGVQIYAEAQTGTIPDATYVLGTYGLGLTDGVHNFNGLLPLSRIYNRALSATEVAQNFNAIRGRYGI